VNAGSLGTASIILPMLPISQSGPDFIPEHSDIKKSHRLRLSDCFILKPSNAGHAKQRETESTTNWLYAQLHYFLNFSQLLVSCLP